MEKFNYNFGYGTFIILGILFIVIGILVYRGTFSNNITPAVDDNNKKMGITSLVLGGISFILLVILLITHMSTKKKITFWS